MKIIVKVAVSENEDEGMMSADIGFELDPTAIKVSELLAKCTYDFGGENVAKSLAHLVCEHIDELFETVSDISKACNDNFAGSTDEFAGYLVSRMTEDATIH